MPRQEAFAGKKPENDVDEEQLAPDAAEAFDRTPAPEGKIEDPELAEMDAELEAAPADAELSHSEKLRMAVDLDTTPAPEGPIGGELGALDRQIQKKKRDDKAAAERLSQMIKEEIGEEDAGDMKKAA